MGRELAVVGLLALVLAGSSVATALVASSQEITGYGATRKAWNAHHVADPKFNPGCCFLPKQRDGYDRYYAVLYDKGRVFMYQMHFAPRVSAKAARRVMKQSELPNDAREVRTVRKPTCEQITYRSATLKRALGHGLVGIEFSATGAGGPYRGIVGDVIVTPVTADAAC